MVALGIRRSRHFGLDLRHPLFNLPGFHLADEYAYSLNLKEWVRGLAALVLIFDIYTLYQQRELQRIRRQLAEREHLFQLITENAADMIAVIDRNGQRLYNSPAYQKILGYGPEELAATSSMDQIHPDDRTRVLEAAEKARNTGRGERLEYRIRHKDGSWRFIESTASAIRSEEGESEGLVIVNRDITREEAGRGEAGPPVLSRRLDQSSEPRAFSRPVATCDYSFPAAHRLQIRGDVHRH